MRILVVDDFSTIRNVTKKLLFDLGFKNVDEADDGLSALKLLQQQPYDFVITDWSMPNLNGIDLLKQIRADQKLKNIPVLLVSSELNHSEISEVVSAGGNGYIVKPFTSTLLKGKMSKIFNAR
jgi:two-component system chemotaxis response regulator CheY